MRYFTLFSFVIACTSLTAQRAIVLSSLPANTPSADIIYLASSANGWNPGDPTWVFADVQGQYILPVPEAAPMTFQGKVTRGSWATVEGNATGGFLPNRTFTFTGADDTLYISVQSWEGNAPPPVDLPPNVVVMDEAFFMPQLNRNRRVRLFLPSNYDSTELNYPVLYMHDGQNLFSAQEAFAGEWQVDEAMLAFEEDGYPGAIVVAIDNGGVHRINEYTPHANAQYGGGEGAEYTDFVVNTLKPFVDAEYRTLPGREHNGIMGSSLGGLISFYAAMGHQSVFSKVGVFSPSFWFNSEIYTFAENEGKQEDMKFFFLAGGQESANLQSQVQQMVNVLENAGFGEEEIRFDFVPNGQHSEWFWAQEFPDAFEWLYMNSSLGSSSFAERQQPRLYPNPTTGTLKLRNGSGLATSARITDTTGRLVHWVPDMDGSVDLSHLPKGMYLVHLHTQGENSVHKLVKQ